MLTQTMLRKHEEKEVFLEKEKKPLFVAALDLIECFTQIKYQRLFFFMGAPISGLPSHIRSMIWSHSTIGAINTIIVHLQ